MPTLTAANVGGLEMRTVAWKLEQLGVTGDLPAMAAALPDLAACFDRLARQTAPSSSSGPPQIPAY